MSVAMAALEPSVPAEPTPRNATRPDVLVVDDDREMCELAEAGLTQRGYSVTWRLNPDEALSLLDREDFAILLVDIHMDTMSGLDLCRAALGIGPYSRRPQLKHPRVSVADRFH